MTVQMRFRCEGPGCDRAFLITCEAGAKILGVDCACGHYTSFKPGSGVLQKTLQDFSWYGGQVDEGVVRAKERVEQWRDYYRARWLGEADVPRPQVPEREPSTSRYLCPVHGGRYKPYQCVCCSVAVKKRMAASIAQGPQCRRPVDGRCLCDPACND